MRRLATLGFLIVAAALRMAAQGSFPITTTTLPPAIIGQPYPPVTLQTSGDPGPMGWSIDGPAGFIVQAGSATTGLFCYVSCAGGPLVQGQPGQYPATIIATSQTTGKTGFQNYTLIVENPLQILTTSLPNANANQAYSTQMVGSGGSGQYTWSILNGTLPQGISLDPFKGSLTGTAPGVNAVYPFTIQLLDQVTQQKATQALSITVVNGVSILTTALPNATANQPYSFQLQGTGQNLVWSIPAGAVFPAGWGLSQSGLITGVGNGPGTLNLPVQLANAQFPSVFVTKSFALLITLGPLSINELALPSATQNVQYSTALTANGGIPPYTWSLGISNLQGLSIGSTSGVLSGTLASSGSFPVLVMLTDSTGASVTKNYTLNVGTGVGIVSLSLPNGSPNVPYSATLMAAGGSVPYHWSVLTGSLPTGLTLEDSGLIHGTPTAQGAFQFTVQVKDFAGGMSTKALTLSIVQPLSILTVTSLPGGSLNQPYSRTLSTVGGTPPVTAWTIISGSLPVGLSLNHSTGEVSGTPTVLGLSSFTVQATDSGNQTATRDLTLLIATPVTASANSFTTSVGAAVSQSVTAAGGVPPYGFLVNSGNLPPGLNLDANTGLISGTPTAAGTFPVTFFVSDIDARFATPNPAITITVNAVPLTIVVPGSTGSGQQSGITVSTPVAAGGDINGTLTLGFASSVGGDDKLVTFQNGSRSITFTIPKGSTTTPNVTVITGTVAGTITLTASVPGSPDVIKTIIIAPAVPVITQVVLQQVTGGLNVVVTGYSNTREVSSGSFTFTVSSGNTLSQATIPVTLSSAYATWFNNTSSNATGGEFKLTVPFSVTQGSATAVTKVSVTLTNGQGASGAVSSQ
jgi:large repetitive protein